MRTDISRLDLGARKRAVLGYTIGTALYALVIVALYPSFEHSTSLDNLTRDSPTMAALFGATGSLTSPAGWLNVNLYANIFPLLILLATIGYGASCLAGQDEEGTLAMTVTLPIPRRRITLEKVLAMAIQATLIVVVGTTVIAFGHFFDIAVSAAHLWGTSLGALLLGIDFGLVALTVGAATGRRGTALGLASAIAAASYLVSSLAPAVAWIRPARFASLFYWSVGDNQLTSGLTAGELVVLLGTAVVLIGLAVSAFKRLDLH
ncbi:MAG TPA: ABC transporter permease subunit [Acidimicrobiales bacterium]|nr:ABC transporter permease subunit [Acidimicrobiales bacterium]